jgi:hypothetical protein
MVAQLLTHQPHRQVAQQPHPAVSGDFWFIALATYFAGVFYFFGYYYFWSSLGGALTGE